MKIQVDDKNYLISFCIIGDNDKCNIEVAQPEDFERNIQYFTAYKLVENALVFDEDKVFDIQKEDAKNQIRMRREQECYKYIDRSIFWYNSLTDEQKSDLAEWYGKWLDAPETGIIPEAPSWLKE